MFGAGRLPRVDRGLSRGLCEFRRGLRRAGDDDKPARSDTDDVDRSDTRPDPNYIPVTDRGTEGYAGSWPSVSAAGESGPGGGDEAGVSRTRLMARTAMACTWMRHPLTSTASP